MATKAFKFTEQELATAIFALRSSGLRWQQCAEAAKLAKHEPLAEQFVVQAKDAYDLAEKLENGA